MLGAIVGGALIFGVSEIFGEVYHSWNRGNEKDVLIKAGNKLADCTEVLEDKAVEIKNKAEAKKNYKKSRTSKRTQDLQPDDIVILDGREHILIRLPDEDGMMLPELVPVF